MLKISQVIQISYHFAHISDSMSTLSFRASALRPRVVPWMCMYAGRGQNNKNRTGKISVEVF